MSQYTKLTEIKKTNEKSPTTTAHSSIDTDVTAKKTDQLEQTISEWFAKENELLSIKEHLGKDDFGDTAILMYENQDAFNHARNLRLKVQISEEQLRIKTKQCNTLAAQKSHLFDILQTSDKQYTQKESVWQQTLEKLQEKNEILCNENDILQEKFDEMKKLAGKYRKRFYNELTSENKNDKKYFESYHTNSSSPRKARSRSPKEANFDSPKEEKSRSPKDGNSRSPKETISLSPIKANSRSPSEAEQRDVAEYSNYKEREYSYHEDDENDTEKILKRIERKEKNKNNESITNTNSTYETDFNETLTDDPQDSYRGKQAPNRNTQTQTIHRRLTGFTAEMHRKMFHVKAMSLRNDQHINTIMSECQHVFSANSKTLDLLYKENQEVTNKLEVWVENYMLLKRQQEDGHEMFQRELKRSWNTEKEYRDQVKDLCQTVNNLTDEACEEKRSLERYKLSLESVYLNIQKMDRQIEFMQGVANEKASINEVRLGNLALKCEQLHQRENGKRRKSAAGSRKISKSIFKLKRRLSESNESVKVAPL